MPIRPVCRFRPGIRWPAPSPEGVSVSGMRVCFIAGQSIRLDPRAVADANSTRAAGHEVVGVSADEHDFPWVTPVTGRSTMDRLRRRGRQERMVRAARATGADLFVPTRPNATDAARIAARGLGTFLTDPAWPGEPDRESLIWRAAKRPSLSLPAGGGEPLLHVPSYRGSEPGAEGPVHIVYRKTDRNPGRYVESALRRRGFETTHAESLMWDSVPARALGVVVVESPLPALPVSGTNPGIPVVFWVHHGEHHLPANVRLQRHYGAHAVALAHSWHLAYRFVGMVDRLPFAVAPELAGGDFVPHGQRTFDVAFVGSIAAGARYRRRHDALEAIAGRLGAGRVAVASGLAPEDMMSIYRDSRIVPDDGAGRHLPITMRVFEAMGAGALLVTREAPGLDLLFQRNGEYVPMIGDGVDQIVALAATDTEPFGRSAHDAAWGRHTYDRRVDDLTSLFSRVRELDLEPPLQGPWPQGLAAGVAAFSDAQRILTLEADLGDQLPDREIWPYPSAAERAERNTFHVATIGGGPADDRHRAVAAARTAVVTEPGLAAEIEPLVTAEHGEHSTHRVGESVVFAFGGFGYRVSAFPDPLATD